MIESGELIENQDGTSAFRPTLISTLDAFPDARQRPRPCTPRGGAYSRMARRSWSCWPTSRAPGNKLAQRSAISLQAPSSAARAFLGPLAINRCAEQRGLVDSAEDLLGLVATHPFGPLLNCKKEGHDENDRVSGLPPAPWVLQLQTRRVAAIGLQLWCTVGGGPAIVLR